VKPILGRLLKTATEDFSNPDIHDRALFLYRLLVTDIELCKRVVTSSSSLVNTYFVEDQDAIEMDRLFEEFNSLSVVYRKSSDLFIKTNFVIDGEADETALEEERAERFRQEEEALYNQSSQNLDFDSATFGIDPSSRPYSAPDLLDGGNSVNETVTLAPQPPSFQLNPNASLDPPTFEKSWKSLPVIETLRIPYIGRLSELRPLDAHLRSHSIKSVAQGAVGPLLRFFLYGQDAATNALILVEFALNTNEMTATATFKSSNPSSVSAFKTLFERVLAIA
jgi:hypothetical protein